MATKAKAPGKRGTLFVYLIFDRHTHLSKLGISDCPSRRLVEVANPDTADVVHYFASSRPFELERALHERFEDKRVTDADGLPTSEWFRLTQAERDMVCMVVEPTNREEDLPAFLLPPRLHEKTFSYWLRHRRVLTTSGTRAEELAEWREQGTEQGTEQG